jgi:hypothetical protein
VRVCRDCGSNDIRDKRNSLCSSCATKRRKKYRKWPVGFDSSAAHRHYKYRLSEEEYLTIYKQQEGRCAICRQELEQPHVDHNHSTMKVRGLLCRSCNLALGHFRDNLIVLSSAINYLARELG